MTLVGVVFLLLGFGIGLSLSVSRRSWVPAALFLYHLTFSLTFWQISLVRSADARMYYAALHPSFRPGTAFVCWVTALVRDNLQASYLDMFMLFHIPGYLGMLMLLDLSLSLYGTSQRARRVIAIALVLPGMQFWTSSIGKDSLIFFAITLFIWCHHRILQRWPGMVFGLVLAALIRPHVATFLGAAWGLSIVLGPRVSAQVRVLAGVGLFVAAGAAAPFLTDFVGLEVIDAEALSDYVERRQGYNLGHGSSVNISEYPFPLQFFTFLYRPLFLDADGPLGLLVSVENTIFLFLSLWTLPRAFKGFWNAKLSTGHLRLNAVFWFLSVSVMAMTTSNLGIAIRLKAMVMPSLIFIILSALSFPKVSEPVARSAPLPRASRPRATRTAAVVAGPQLPLAPKPLQAGHKVQET
jgi:hypothetical protein